MKFIRDIFGYLVVDKDSIDGRDEYDSIWDDDEITEITKKLNAPGVAYPWLDFSSWKPKTYDCDCGAKVAKTTCATWCSKNKGFNQWPF